MMIQEKKEKNPSLNYSSHMKWWVLAGNSLLALVSSK